MHTASMDKSFQAKHKCNYVDAFVTHSSLLSHWPPHVKDEKKKKTEMNKTPTSAYL